MNTAPVTAAPRRHRPLVGVGFAALAVAALAAASAAALIALAAVAAVLGAALAIAKARKASAAFDQVPAAFVREAEETTEQDWEPAIPLR